MHAHSCTECCMSTALRHPEGLHSEHSDWSSHSSVFLRNIPARCNHDMLSSFFRDQGVDHFDLEMAKFRNGKSRGYARVSLQDEASTRDFVQRVHGRNIPGFAKQKALACEPFTPWQPDPPGPSSNCSEAQQETPETRSGADSSHSTSSPSRGQTSVPATSE